MYSLTSNKGTVQSARNNATQAERGDLLCHFLSKVKHVTAFDMIRKFVEIKKSGKAPGVRNVIHAWYLCCRLSAYQEPTLNAKRW